MKRIKQSKVQKREAALCRAEEEGLIKATFEQTPDNQTRLNLGGKCSHRGNNTCKGLREKGARWCEKGRGEGLGVKKE